MGSSLSRGPIRSIGVRVRRFNFQNLVCSRINVLAQHGLPDDQLELVRLPAPTNAGSEIKHVLPPPRHVAPKAFDGPCLRCSPLATVVQRSDRPGGDGRIVKVLRPSVLVDQVLGLYLDPGTVRAVQAGFERTFARKTDVGVG